MVLADYDKIANFKNIYANMDPKSDPKFDIWALRDHDFEILGGFLKRRIFDEFSIGEKSA